MCGDARDRRSFETLLDGELAQMVFTDPPYNVLIDGNVRGLGRVRHKEFAMASASCPRPNSQTSLRSSCSTCARTAATAPSITSAWIGAISASC